MNAGKTALTVTPGYLVSSTDQLYYVIGMIDDTHGSWVHVAQFSRRKDAYTVTLFTLRPSAYKRILAGAQRVQEPSSHPKTGADLTTAKQRLAERLKTLPQPEKR